MPTIVQEMEHPLRVLFVRRFFQNVIIDRSSAADQYSPGNQAPASKTQGENVQAAPAAAAAEASNLPFTGISLLATALVGLALILSGLALRRRERRSS